MPERNRRRVGHALRALRERARLTPWEVAKRIDMNVGEIRSVELAGSEIRYETLVAFLGAVGASWQEFQLVLDGRDPEDMAEVAQDLGGALLMLAEQLRRSAR